MKTMMLRQGVISLGNFLGNLLYCIFVCDQLKFYLGLKQTCRQSSQQQACIDQIIVDMRLWGGPALAVR